MAGADPPLTTESLLALLSKELQQFGDSYYTLHPDRLQSVKKASKLVQQGVKDVKRHTRKKRASIILTDFWNYIPEVFVLCSLCITPTRLGDLKSQTYLQRTAEWWDHCDQPTGLKETVNQISHLLPTKESCDIELGSALSSPRPSKLTGISASATGGSAEANREHESAALAGAATDEPTGEAAAPLSLTFSQTVTKLQPGDVFGFLTQFRGGCTPLEIQLCPEDPTFLPSMEIKFQSSNGVDAKLVLKRDTCRELIRYVIENGRSELEFRS